MRLSIGFLLAIVGIIFAWIIPTFYWFSHDYLTSMQIFKHFWFMYISGSVSYIAGYIILQNWK